MHQKVVKITAGKISCLPKKEGGWSSNSSSQLRLIVCKGWTGHLGQNGTKQTTRGRLILSSGFARPGPWIFSTLNWIPKKTILTKKACQLSSMLYRMNSSFWRDRRKEGSQIPTGCFSLGQASVTYLRGKEWAAIKGSPPPPPPTLLIFMYCGKG